jgi:Flp pilus assembly pilin Flp
MNAAGAQASAARPTSEGEDVMDLLFRPRWLAALSRGQTMTEYIMIVSAIAVVVFAGYQQLGTTVNSMVTSVDGLL